MNSKQNGHTAKCCEPGPSDCGCETGLKSPFPMHREDAGEVCCGGSVASNSQPDEKPGYQICNFVEEFIQTPVGSVPRISTRIDSADRWGTFKVRSGIGRNEYKVTPGLYCVGHPGPDDPVLITANYKLTFDTLRNELDELAVWLLVLDTCGVNVWCAAGKGTFATAELVQRISEVGLEKCVNHRRIILPQLSATGVAAHRVKKESGFKVVWGPIRAKDLPRFLSNAMQIEPKMRRVTFGCLERLVLIPVELAALPKYIFWFALAVFVLSGIGISVFSIGAAFWRGLQLFSAGLAGVVAGAIITPALLPWIPSRAFSAKGAITGIIVGLIVVTLFSQYLGLWGAVAMLLCTTAISSFLAMNFTGATPFTSPSGVEKEMRRAIPLQATAVMIAAVCWVTAAFV